MVKQGKNTNKNFWASALKKEDKEQLIRIIIQQSELIERQQEENEELKRRLRELEEKIEELERRNHRQAAPFRRDESKKVSHRRRPGRRKGHRGNYRQAPQEVDETVEFPLEGCPKCGGVPATVTPVIGKNYQGTLVSDCLAVYDDVNQSQQKCYSHHLKEIKKARE
jgi:hypothetical protein